MLQTQNLEILRFLLIIPIIIIGPYGIFLFEEKLLDSKLEAQKTLADNKINELSSLITLRSEEADLIAGTYIPRQLDGLEPSPELLEQIQLAIDSINRSREGRDTIDVILIADINGKILASTQKSLIGKSVPQSYIDDYQKTGKNFVGYDKGKLVDRNLEIFVSEIRNFNTAESVGYVILKVEPTILLDLTSDDFLTELDFSRIDIVNTDYIALTAVNEDPSTLLNLNMKSDALVDCFNGVDTYGEFVNHQNKNVFGVVEYMEPFDWCMVLEADLDVVLSEVHSLERIFYTSTVGIVALTIFLNYAVSRKIKSIQKEKDDYVGMITHDLKQAFFPIHIATSMLKDPQLGTLSTQQLERVMDIEELSAKQLAMFGNMLAAQKIGAKAISYNIKKLDAKEVIQQAIKNNKPLMISKDIKLFTLLDEDIQIRADRSFILEVFTNLILNSYDFVSEKGVIELGATKNDKFATFFVKDNGRGIAKDKLSSLFKPYASLVSDMKRDFGGTGLGLAVSKELVQGMGGKIWAESTMGKETTFYFMIPLSK